jgi:hypothetical protein
MSPIPLSILAVLAPETLQDNMAGWPAVIVEGVAVNEVMAGAGVAGGFGPTCTLPLAEAKPLAHAVMIADPILMPLTVGARLGVSAPCGMKMFSGATVTFEGSLLVSVMNTPPDGAAVTNVTGNGADSPGATVTLAGRRICPGTMAVPIVTVVRAVALPALLVAVKI